MKLKSITAVLLTAVLAAGLCACSGGGGEVVYAQSVRWLNGMGSVGIADRFAGVAVSGRTKEIKKDSSLTVEEIKVEEGQLVKVGDVLFTYNNEAAALSVEQAKLEIESLKNKIEVDNSQIAALTKDRDAASSSAKLGYTLEIQSLQADIKETQYNIGVKEKELKKLEESLGDTQVKSDIAGRVTSINSSGETGEDGSEKPFITIVEVGNLRVKGTINEMNRGALNEGDEVTIRSRTDETQTWKGKIQSIDWENAEQSGQNGMYYEGPTDEMTTSSRYPFYINVENPEGLIIGQHVYIEPGEAVSDWADHLMLPAAFINDPDDAPWVWAANARDKLEKREITLGDYDEMTDEYAILSGLTEDDYVVFPEESLQPGRKVEKIDGEIPMDEGDFEEGYDGDPEGDLPDGGFDGEESFDGQVFDGAAAGGEALPDEMTGEGDEGV